MLSVTLAAAVGGQAAIAANRSLEYAIKATFLYKFAPFVDWPASAFEQPNSPFVICIAGNAPIGAEIDKAAAGQRVGEHPVVVRRLTVVDGQTRCHVLFVAGSPEQSAQDALAAVKGSATLTVTDVAPAGAVVQFVIVDDRVNFNIDTVAAADNHLVVSSKLLALAHVVRGASKDARP